MRGRNQLIYKVSVNLLFLLCCAAGLGGGPAHAEDLLLLEPLRTARSCAGSTEAGDTDWKNYDHHRPSKGLYVDIALGKCNFARAPLVFVNVHGNNGVWELTGTATAYDVSVRNFKVYIKFADDKLAKETNLSPDFANSQYWHVQWLAIEPPDGPGWE